MAANIHTNIADFAPGLENCLLAEVREASYVVDRIEGELPPHLCGTYLMNGPARFKVGDVRYRNWLDGDGMVCALRFGESETTFTSRFIAGKKYSDETRENAAMYATFGTRFEGDRMRRRIMIESPYNVSVVHFRDRLLAFGEQSIPLELHPETLETIGEFDFDRQINALSPFLAHPKVDPSSGELVNIGVSFSGSQPTLNYYRFRGDDGVLACRKRTKIDHPCSIHDFALSERFATVHLSPYVLDITKLLQESASPHDALEWKPELGTHLLVLDRKTGELVASLPAGEKYSLHTINSFDDDNKLTVDLIELDRPVYDQYQEMPDLLVDVPQGNPVRYVIDLSEPAIERRQVLPYANAPDFPNVDPRRESQDYDDFWMLGISAAGKRGRKFFDQLVRCSWDGADPEIIQADSECYFGGEPVFIPNPDRPAAGEIICQEMNAAFKTSSFVVFDAFDLSRGPLARVKLRNQIHFGFHTTFAPSYTP